MSNSFVLEHPFFFSDFCPNSRYIFIVDFVNENSGPASLKLIACSEQEASKWN